MCVAAPGVVIKVENDMAQIDFLGNRVMAHAGITEVKPGDYVLVHAGMVIQRLLKKEAEEMLELFDELENLKDGNESGYR